MKIKKIWQKVLSFISVLIFAGSVLLLGSVLYQRATGAKVPMILGWGFASVETGSMEPVMPIGSFILIQKQDGYQVGDIIAYKSDTMRKPVTHRLVAIEDGVVTAKGDANNIEDKPFAEDAIIGKVQFILPGAGSMLSKLMRPTVIAGLVALVIIVYAASAIIQRREKVEKNE